MNALDADLAALAAGPAPAALAGLETAVLYRVVSAQPALGWPLRGALAATALMIGLLIGATTPAAPLPTGTGLLLASSAPLLPSTLLLAGAS